MIGSLVGTVTHIQIPLLILEVNGVGYEIEAPLSTLSQLSIGQNIQLWTHFVVREDAQLLYGFSDLEQKSLFKTLIKINGVGPKMAVAILSSFSPSDLVLAVSQQNHASLTKIPGVGKKTAERLVIELKDRLQGITPSQSPQSSAQSLSPQLSIDQEAISALMSLGYKSHEAEAAVNYAHNQQADISEVGQLIRLSLKSMMRS